MPDASLSSPFFPPHPDCRQELSTPSTHSLRYTVRQTDISTVYEVATISCIRIPPVAEGRGLLVVVWEVFQPDRAA